jgi:hypothetical protein
VGLALEAALGLIGEQRAAGSVHHAISGLDMAFRDIRDMVFDSLPPAGQARAFRALPGAVQAVVPGSWRAIGRGQEAARASATRFRNDWVVAVAARCKIALRDPVPRAANRGPQAPAS